VAEVAVAVVGAPVAVAIARGAAMPVVRISMDSQLAGAGIGARDSLWSDE
jgi:hypothetical protein